MTNDQVWHQSTVMERCEILRSRLDRIEHPVPEVAPEWKAIDDLARRVAEIENRDARPPEVKLTRSELARLRRIEAAARRYSDHTAAQPCYGEADQREWNLLRAALGSEPNR